MTSIVVDVCTASPSRGTGLPLQVPHMHTTAHRLVVDKAIRTSKSRTKVFSDPRLKMGAIDPALLLPDIKSLSEEHLFTNTVSISRMVISASRSYYRGTSQLWGKGGFTVGETTVDEHALRISTQHMLHGGREQTRTAPRYGCG